LIAGIKYIHFKYLAMSTYADLTLNSFYLIKESEEDEIQLIQLVMETNECYLVNNRDEFEGTFWRKKDDYIFEIVDELTEEQVAEYEELFEEDDEEEWVEE